VAVAVNSHTGIVSSFLSELVPKVRVKVSIGVRIRARVRVSVKVRSALGPSCTDSHAELTSVKAPPILAVFL